MKFNLRIKIRFIQKCRLWTLQLASSREKSQHEYTSQSPDKHVCAIFAHRAVRNWFQGQQLCSNHVQLFNNLTHQSLWNHVLKACNMYVGLAPPLSLPRRAEQNSLSTSHYPSLPPLVRQNSGRISCLPRPSNHPNTSPSQDIGVLLCWPIKVSVLHHLTSRVHKTTAKLETDW